MNCLSATFDFGLTHLKGTNCLLRSLEGMEETGFPFSRCSRERQRTARDKESYGEDQRTLGHSARLQILLFYRDKARLAL